MTSEPDSMAVAPPSPGLAAGKTPAIVVWALVLSILGLFGITAVVGLILGFVGRGQAKKAGAGVGTATAAIIIGAAWIVFFVIIGIFESSDSTSPAPKSEPSDAAAGYMSGADWGNRWPLTVDYGTVSCEQGSWVIFRAPDGMQYAVNGSAMMGTTLPSIRKIWAVNPSIEGSRIDISPIIDTGLAICDGTTPPPLPAEETFPSVDTSTMPKGSFADIESLRKAYVAAGGDCSDWAGSESFDDGSTSGGCSATNVIIWYGNPDDVPVDAARLARVDGPLVVGPNWIVNADDAAKVAKALGGTLVKQGADVPQPDPTPGQGGIPNCPATPIRVAIDYTTERDSDGGLLILARSNLPDGSELLTSLTSSTGDYMAQDAASLVNGSAIFGPFMDGDAGLNPGQYDVSITFPASQPRPIQRCIGPAGENLVGPLVHYFKILETNIASREATVTIR